MADQQIDDFLGVKQPPRWRRYLKWALVALGVVGLLLILNRCFRAEEAVQYSTATARRGDLTVTVSATGKLAPTNQVTVGSQLSGLVTRVVVDVNDRVAANQPLALIDPEQIDAQIRQGEAAVAAAQAQVNQARVRRRRR
jgi:HlyD family secretion protein